MPPEERPLLFFDRPSRANRFIPLIPDTCFAFFLAAAGRFLEDPQVGFFAALAPAFFAVGFFALFFEAS